MIGLAVARDSSISGWREGASIGLSEREARVVCDVVESPTFPSDGVPSGQLAITHAVSGGATSPFVIGAAMADLVWLLTERPGVPTRERVHDIVDQDLGDPGASMLKVKRERLWSMSRGEIPTVRLGLRDVRYRPQDIDAWIARRTSSRPRGTQS